MLNQRKPIDSILQALSEPARRGIVEALAQGPMAVSKLAERLNMSLPGVIQHLAVLNNARLIQSEKNGRVRTVSLRAEALSDLEFWVSIQRNNWQRKLDHLGAYLEGGTLNNDQEKQEKDGT